MTKARKASTSQQDTGRPTLNDFDYMRDVGIVMEPVASPYPGVQEYRFVTKRPSDGRSRQ